MRVLRIARADAERMLGSRRVAGVIALQLLVAYLAGASVRVNSMSLHVHAAALDVHAAGLNSWALVNYLLFVGFLALVGDTVIADRASGWAWITATRSPSRIQWWSGKALAIAFVAIGFHVAYLLECTAIGMVRLGLPLWRHASPFAAYSSPTPSVSPLFARVPEGTDMLLRQSILVGYEALGFTVLALALVALTARLRQASLPAGVGLGYMVVDYLLVKQFDAWVPFSVGRRLLESTHAPIPGVFTPPASWVVSVAVLSIIGVTALIGGGLLLSSVDL